MIIIAIIVIIITGSLCYWRYKKCKDNLERILYIILFFIALVPITIYYLDKYNIPTLLGWATNVNTQNWLGFLSSYSSGIISAIISAVVLVGITTFQIKRNNEDNIKRDQENLRIQNLPILKYSFDANKKITEPEDVKIDDLIITNIDDGNPYDFNMTIKNVGLNTIKNIKIDFESKQLSKSIYRIIGKETVISIEKGEEIQINKYFQLKNTDTPYKINIIVYYEDVLSNWYKQVVEINYIATNLFKNGYIGQIDNNIKEEELLKIK